MAASREALSRFQRRFVLALQTATRLRVQRLLAPAGEAPPQGEPNDQARSVAHLPGAGWLVGIVAGLTFAVVAVLLRGNGWGPAVAAIMATTAVLLLTGARNESEVFRWADGLGAGAGGGYGVMALVLLLLGRVALLAALAAASEPAIMAALFAGPVVSRLAPLVVAQGDEGAHDPASIRVAVLWCVLPLVLMVPAGGPAFLVLAVLGAGVGTFLARRYGPRRPGGVVQQACEIGFYLGAAFGA